MPGLRELYLQALGFSPPSFPDFSSLIHLQYLNLRGDALPWTHNISPSLEYLKLEGNLWARYHRISGNLTSLTQLRGIYFATGGDVKSVTRFFQFPESLELLRMPRYPFDLDTEINYRTKLHSLKIVDFSEARYLTLPRLKALPNRSKTLPPFSCRHLFRFRERRRLVRTDNMC